MLHYLLRCWANIEPTVGQCRVFALMVNAFFTQGDELSPTLAMSQWLFSTKCALTQVMLSQSVRFFIILLWSTRWSVGE